MFLKPLKQLLSSAVHNHDSLRRLKHEMELMPVRILGQRWAGGRKWSEHGEDELLLKLIEPEMLHGYYVDVGANLPGKRSNTFRLYCHGMSGLCVEPNLELAALLERHRSRDSVVCACIGSENGAATLNRFNYHVFSTCSEAEAESRAQSSRSTLKTKLLRRAIVPSIRLDTLLAHWESELGKAPVGARESRPFVLLKVDTEGWDLQVLQSNDWSKHSPQYVLTESTGAEEKIGQFLGEKGYQLLRRFPVNQLYSKEKQP